jgi:hypothetical protein
METPDPFAGSTKTPSLSWHLCPIGTTFSLKILEAPKLLQSRDFDLGVPAWWDNEHTQPKMSAVVNVRVLTGPHSVGEDRTIWAAKPSALFQAIAAAQDAAGERLAVGGTLSLRLHSEQPHKNKRFNPIKIYEAQYIPPVAFAGATTPHSPPAQEPRPAPTAPVWPGWGHPHDSVAPAPVAPTW